MEAGGARLIRYPREDSEFSIWDIADIHYTNRGCLTSKLLRDIAGIKRDPHSLWTLGGDSCDWIVPGDPRFDPECVDEDMKVCDLARYGALVTEKLCDMFSGIAERCLGAGYGNHDLRYYTATQAKYLHDQMCASLRVPNLRFSAVMVLYFEHCPSLSKTKYSKTPPKEAVNQKGQRRLTVYQHHGFGAAATAGGKINALKRAVDSVDADLVMMGHLHEQLSKVFIRLGTDAYGKSIGERACVAMMTGSYLRGNPPGCTQYSEVRGYPPATLGATRARFRPVDGRLIVENKADNVGVICE